MQSRTPEERRSRFLAASLPIGMVGLFVLAAGGFLAATFFGGEASGARAEVRWSSACPEDWADVARTRSREIGLGDPQVFVEGDQTVVVATLPGNEDDLESIPALLAGDGAWAIHEASSLQGPPLGEALATNVDITSMWFNIDYSGHAYTQIELQPAALKRVTESTEVLVFLVGGEIVSGFEHEETADPDDLRLQDASAPTKEDEVRSAIEEGRS